jgi:hypothetical protein
MVFRSVFHAVGPAALAIDRIEDVRSATISFCQALRVGNAWQ